jgi:RNA polymerase sigma factor (sigma-70 family)
MTTHTLSADTSEDTILVTQSLAGSRDAFGRIVERYQSLVCAVAFSATGSVTRSEDLAQETFLTAWQQLRQLREPAKLRAWLCGIARNTINADRRRQGREPIHRAAQLSEETELPAPEPAPASQVISNEEVALLWREVGQLPEIYREPFVLFYREHRSVAHVAAALELSEDAVLQRLSRGRKLLHERMLVFVESALDRTNPGKQFALGVQAALPLLAVGGQGAGLATVKGAAMKGGGLAGLSALAMPVAGMLAAVGVCWSSIRYAANPDERRFMKTWNLVLWSSIGAFMLGLYGADALGSAWHWEVRTTLFAGVGVWCCYLMVLAMLLVVMYRRGVEGQRWPTGTPQEMPRGMLVGMYCATSSWMIGLAWMMGDRVSAAFIAVATIGMAAWNVHARRHRTGVALHQLTSGCQATLCGVLLVVVNLRVDRWLAPIYHVPLDEMHRLLPMSAIHVLTVLLLGWIGALLALTGRKT